MVQRRRPKFLSMGGSFVVRLFLRHSLWHFLFGSILMAHIIYKNLSNVSGILTANSLILKKWLLHHDGYRADDRLLRKKKKQFPLCWSHFPRMPDLDSDSILRELHPGPFYFRHICPIAAHTTSWAVWRGIFLHSVDLLVCRTSRYNSSSSSSSNSNA